jgi:hypothetical protein
MNKERTTPKNLLDRQCNERRTIRNIEKNLRKKIHQSPAKLVVEAALPWTFSKRR